MYKLTFNRLLSFIFLFLLLMPAVDAANKKQIKVLTVHSYHQEYPWTFSQNRAFKKQLQAKLPEYNITFATEYLDTKHINPTDEYQKEFIHYLHAKYKNNLPHLIYVTDDNSLKFIYSGTTPLSWNVPVVFSGINNTDIGKPDNNLRAVGVFERKDIQSSIALAKLIEPGSSQIIFLGDGGTTDSAIKAMIKTFAHQSKKIQFIYLSDSKLNKVIEKLNAYKQGIVVLTTVGGIHDSDGNLLSLQKIVKSLTDTGKKILVMEDAYLYPDVLGGYVTSGSIQGKSAADIASRLIIGEPAKKIHNKNKLLNEFVLSWPAMQRFGISASDEEYNKARIINLPIPFIDRYPGLVNWLIWAVLLLFIILMRFILKAKQKSQLLREQYTDKVTGLQNRVRLLSDINAATAPCLIIIDINNFKSINNLYGLKVGDDLLNSFGRKIKDEISSEYRVYRLGGNQFGILTKQKLSASVVDTYIKSFLNDIQNNHFYIDDLDISLTLTAGISRNEYDLLIPRAEQALQRAKEANKSIFIIDKAEEDTDKHQKNLLWAQKVNSALTSNRIVPYFQSITHNKTGVIKKYEALVRLIDDDGSVIAPFFFLEAAKSTRQYAALTKAMIDKTFQAVENKAISISINFTVDDIRNENTIAYFITKLAEYKIADKVIVELIESEGIENYTEVAEFISDIKKLGCRVAIDDFGTGYSNFTHLIHLNVDYLKIDGSIIQNILTDKNSEIVAKTLVDFARQLGIETIAEFVDSQEILDKVTAMGIDYSQGYFLGKPESTLSG